MLPTVTQDGQVDCCFWRHFRDGKLQIALIGQGFVVYLQYDIAPPKSRFLSGASRCHIADQRTCTSSCPTEFLGQLRRYVLNNDTK